MYVKMVVTGKLLYVTDRYYVTRTCIGIVTWNKKWYRLSYEG
jgi:hypothetical protein